MTKRAEKQRRKTKSGGRAADLEATKAEFIDTFFRRGQEFSLELLQENERLRYRVAELEGRPAPAPGAEATGATPPPSQQMVSRLQELEAERDSLLDRFRGVEQQNRDFQQRYADIERENNNLANLYVASFQLHSTLELREVTQVIVEILINFVGARTLAIQLVDEERGILRTLAADGIEREAVPEPKVGQGRVGEVVTSGRPLYDEPRLRMRVDLEQPAIVVPLQIRDKVVGVILVWDLLVQKSSLADVDYELFNLLSAHGASALFAAKLGAELGARPAALWAAVDLL